MRNSRLGVFASLILSVAVSFTASADKRPLDHSVYDAWQTSRIYRLSADADLLVWSVNPQQGDGELHVRRISNDQEIVIPRGQDLVMTEDSKVAKLTIKPAYEQTRKAKIAKKKKEEMPKDTLAYLRLSDLNLVKLTNSFANVPDSLAKKIKLNIAGASIGTSSSPYVFVKYSYTEKKKSITNLAVVDYQTGAIVDTLKNIKDYYLNSNASKVVLVSAKDKKDSLSFDGVMLWDVAERRCDTLSRGLKSYKGFRFNHNGDKLVFLGSDQEAKKVGTLSYGVYLAEEKTISKATRRKPAVKQVTTSNILPQCYSGCPEGWLVTEKSNPQFSNKDSRIILNIGAYIPAKDTTVVDFEAAGLDIWRWDSPEVPPMWKKGAGQNPARSAIINLAKPGEMMVVANNEHEGVYYFQGGDADFAVARDEDKYIITNMWDGESSFDYYLINLKDGSRKLLKEKYRGGLSWTVNGKYFAMFNQEDLNWYSYNVATGETVNLTGKLGINFQDTSDDHPISPRSYGHGGWLGNDEYFLVYDEFDIWKCKPDGSSVVCLTKGEGRRTKVQYRVVKFERDSETNWFQNMNMVPVKGKIYLTTFDTESQENGFATIDTAVPAIPQGFTAKFAYQNMYKSKGNDRIVFQKGNYNLPNDIYLTTDDFKTDEKVTAINPQMKDYLWGNAELVKWTAYDGTELKGILYTPENLDKSKKYPMMVYFYEKNAFTLYRYMSAAPSRSIINIPLYTSQGYVVFVPDIVYKVGHPGESAYNCICSGAEAMCNQFSFIDKNKMAIQGQSWGGYQVAYLVGRTDMFAAGGAGAPVSNMTSAYGGIRWGTGHSRIGQYEHGQSRVGKTLWEEGGLDLYIENSPLFNSPKVNTPLLIMHNDNDGAVPWYQGIEYFMALRRLNKPVWLLEYNNEEHNLVQRRNCKDLSIRLLQFFDHYLKDKPMPVWMKDGVPHQRKGNYFGYELSE